MHLAIDIGIAIAVDNHPADDSDSTSPFVVDAALSRHAKTDVLPQQRAAELSSDLRRSVAKRDGQQGVNLPVRIQSKVSQPGPRPTTPFGHTGTSYTYTYSILRFSSSSTLPQHLQSQLTALHRRCRIAL